MIPLLPRRQRLLFRRQRGSYLPGQVEGTSLVLSAQLASAMSCT